MTEETKNKGGRPRKIQSPEEFDALVDEYVEEQKANEEPILWTGMALYLGFTSREAIDEYQDYAGFSDSVKRAKLIVQMSYEGRLHGHNPTGSIFALKNMGWKDKVEQELTATHHHISDEPMDTDAWLAQYSDEEQSDSVH